MSLVFIAYFKSFKNCRAYLISNMRLVPAMEPRREGINKSTDYLTASVGGIRHLVYDSLPC